MSGTGVGISMGSGSGGMGDSWYARTVEARVGGNWSKPIGLQQRIEIIYSFLVGDDGRIYEIKLEKSSGNDALDLSAERAIRASNPLSVPPPELRGKLLQFTAVFVYPQDK
jgi:TonB family protein